MRQAQVRTLAIIGLLLWLVSMGTSSAEQGFDEKYQRDFNIFNPINQYQPTNPLNPINAYDPANPFNPINQFDPGNPANPINQFNPNNPFNPVNRYNPENPLNPINEFNPTVPFAPLGGRGETGKRGERRFPFPGDRKHVGKMDCSRKAYW
ncbi:MAG: hypothetical protein QM771_17125 [Nitrospira sp.]